MVGDLQPTHLQKESDCGVDCSQITGTNFRSYNICKFPTFDFQFSIFTLQLSETIACLVSNKRVAVKHIALRP